MANYNKMANEFMKKGGVTAPSKTIAVPIGSTFRPSPTGMKTGIPPTNLKRRPLPKKGLPTPNLRKMLIKKGIPKLNYDGFLADGTPNYKRYPAKR